VLTLLHQLNSASPVPPRRARALVRKL